MYSGHRFFTETPRPLTGAGRPMALPRRERTAGIRDGLDLTPVARCGTFSARPSTSARKGVGPHQLAQPGLGTVVEDWRGVGGWHGFVPRYRQPAKMAPTTVWPLSWWAL